MKLILDALASLGFPVWDTDATGADFTQETLPFLIVMGSHGQPGTETGFTPADSEDELRVRHVGSSPEQVRLLAERTRRVLALRTLTSGGVLSQLSRPNTSMVITDPSILIRGTSQHPVFLDDTYTVWTQTTK